MKRKNNLVATFLILIGISLFVLQNGYAQSNTESDIISITLDVNDADGVLYNEKTIQAFAEIKNAADKQMQVYVRWKILTDNHFPLFDVTVPQKVEANATLKSYCPLYQFQGPGFYQIKVEVTTENGKVLRNRKTIGIDPEKITAQ